jgi:hypothetical protein
VCNVGWLSISSMCLSCSAREPPVAHLLGRRQPGLGSTGLVTLASPQHIGVCHPTATSGAATRLQLARPVQVGSCASKPQHGVGARLCIMGMLHDKHAHGIPDPGMHKRASHASAQHDVRVIQAYGEVGCSVCFLLTPCSATMLGYVTMMGLLISNKSTYMFGRVVKLQQRCMHIAICAGSNMLSIPLQHSSSRSRDLLHCTRLLAHASTSSFSDGLALLAHG